MPVSESPTVAKPGRILTGHFLKTDEYSAFRSHGTRDWLLIYTIQGNGRFGYWPTTSSDAFGEILTRTGDATLLRPGTLHDYGIAPTAKRWDILWAHFDPRPAWLAWLNWPTAAPGSDGLMRLSLADVRLQQRVEAALARMHRRAISPRRARVDFAMNALEEALLWMDTQIPRGRADVDPRVEQAQEFLCSRLHEAVRLSDVADAVGLSISRLSELFHRQTGLTLQKYYESQKLDRAGQLLEMTDMPVKQVAREVGFANPFYFTLRFKRHTGKSPRAYRADLMRR